MFVWIFFFVGFCICFYYVLTNIKRQIKNSLQSPDKILWTFSSHSYIFIFTYTHFLHSTTSWDTTAKTPVCLLFLIFSGIYFPLCVCQSVSHSFSQSFTQSEWIVVLFCFFKRYFIFSFLKRFLVHFYINLKFFYTLTMDYEKCELKIKRFFQFFFFLFSFSSIICLHLKYGEQGLNWDNMCKYKLKVVCDLLSFPLLGTY